MKPSNVEFTAFVGLDWADAKHDICVQAAGCEVREFDRFRHKVAAIDEWAHSDQSPTSANWRRLIARLWYR